MIAETFPRPVPILNMLFNDKTVDGLYVATEADPLQKLKEFQRTFEWASSDPKIENAYKNDRGDVLFRLWPHNEYYILPKGENAAYEFHDAGYGGSTKEFEASFLHEFDSNRKFRLKVNENTGEISIVRGLKQPAGGISQQDVATLKVLTDEEKSALLKNIVEKEISFIAPPDIRAIELAAKSADGTYFVVSCNRQNYQYESLRVFKGPALDKLEELEVTNVNRLRDGGTTWYECKEGTIFSPTSFHPERKVQWCSSAEGSRTEILEKLDAKDISQKVVDLRLVGAAKWSGDEAKPTGMA